MILQLVSTLILHTRLKNRQDVSTARRHFFQLTFTIRTITFFNFRHTIDRKSHFTCQFETVMNGTSTSRYVGFGFSRFVFFFRGEKVKSDRYYTSKKETSTYSFEDNCADVRRYLQVVLMRYFSLIL